MGTEAGKSSYPYSKTRVLFSAIITVLSVFLAVAVLMDSFILILCYALATLALTITTFLAKTRLYSFIVQREQQLESAPEQAERVRTPWKALLFTFLMLIAFLIAPLFLAGVLGGEVWFILMVSFTSGVSISEIVIYLRAHPQGTSQLESAQVQ